MLTVKKVIRRSSRPPGEKVRKTRSWGPPLPASDHYTAICMGHQLISRALGAETYKLKFGHHGTNHPVQDLETGRIMITSQNHGFCVKEDTLKDKDVRVSHINLNDRTVEGITSKKHGFYSVQFHPEAKPGPSDASVIFDIFMKGYVK